MKTFILYRKEDESGVSGTGEVAQGVIFDNGRVVLTWMTPHTSVAVYDSIEEVVAIHGHGGKTQVLQTADLELDGKNGIRHLYTNWCQDVIEGVQSDFLKGNHKYMWEQREHFAKLFETKNLAEVKDA